MFESVKTTIRSIFLVAALLSPAETQAQKTAPAPEGTWRWNFNGNVFAGLNYQHRKFTDFQNFESQNWAMASGRSGAASSRCTR